MGTKFIKWFLFLVAIALVIAGVFIIRESQSMFEKSLEFSQNNKTPTPVAPQYLLFKEGFSQALFYFTLAIGVCLLALMTDRLSSIMIGPSGITLALKDITAQVKSLAQLNNSMEMRSISDGGVNLRGFLPEVRNLNEGAPVEREMVQPLIVTDTQKGKWGGMQTRSKRTVSASIASLPAGYFTVKILVTSTDPKNELRGLVRFHLPDSFQNPRPSIVAIDGKAELRIEKINGPFTVGVEIIEEDIVLELDLGKVENAPASFKRLPG